MRTPYLVGCLAAIALVGLLAACDDPGSKVPTRPTVASTSSAEMIGPASVAPGQSAQFGLLVRRSDGTSKLASSVSWKSSNSNLRVDASGLVTALQVGDAELTAQATIDGSSRGSIRQIVMVPDGTYRVVGEVRDAEFSGVRLAGARVEATPGSVATTTNLNGQYRLYGVPPDATIQVTKDGYLPSVQNIQLTAHVTQNFQLSPSGPSTNVAGPYTLAIDVADTCPNSASSLPPHVRHRTYDAFVTQTGRTVEVQLTEPRFRINRIGLGNWFSGRVDGASVTFSIPGWDGPSYYPLYGPEDYPSLVEQLPDGTVLIVSGSGLTASASGGFSGTMDGFLQYWDARFPAAVSSLGGCGGQKIFRFTLSPR